MQQYEALWYSRDQQDDEIERGAVKASPLTQQVAYKANKALEQGIVKAGKTRQGWQGNTARWVSVEAAKETQSRLQSNTAMCGTVVQL